MPFGVHFRRVMFEIVVGPLDGGVLSVCSEPYLEGVAPRGSIVRRFLFNRPKSFAMIDDGSEPVRCSFDSISASEAAAEGRVLMPWIRDVNFRLTVEFMVV